MLLLDLIVDRYGKIAVNVGDDIVTGPTGTNVNDLKILLVGKG
jgi:glycerate-2-kinase